MASDKPPQLLLLDTKEVSTVVTHKPNEEKQLSDVAPLLSRTSPQSRPGCLGKTLMLTLTFLLVLVTWRSWSHGGEYGDPVSPINAHQEFQALPDPKYLQQHLRYYTSGVALAGLNKSQAEWTQAQFQAYGLPEVRIEEYQPLLNYPQQQRLAIVEPPELAFEADLHEPVVDEDPTSHLQAEIPPAFHGYSASGNVTAAVIYANYGSPEDYRQLQQHNVSVQGKIVLVRYGELFRGIKVQLAEEHGAVGVIIYSDPAEDGFGQGDTYPEGPWRPSTSVQRGSVMNLAQYPGDPLTPGVPAKEGVPRIPRDQAVNLPTIPSLPLSYSAAQVLFRALLGQGVNVTEAMPAWKGGLPLSYFTGPSIARVNLVNIMEDKIAPIWNVIARIPGKVEPDRAVIVGNHRDSWVFGASDPGSGSASLLEIGRSLGQLLQKGWRPRRTIYLCSWDAEEYGLVGSTEWVEDHLNSWLKEQAVAYLNTDMAVNGPYFITSGSPLFTNLVYQEARQVPIPGTNETVYDRWVKTMKGQDPPPFFGLGSGSDFSAFYDHAGIPFLDMAFMGYSGTYHSAYDSIHWMEKFIDPDYIYHQTITRLLGSVLLRLVDDPLVPLDLGAYPPALNGYLDKLGRLLDQEPRPESSSNISPGPGAVSDSTSSDLALSFQKAPKSTQQLRGLYRAVKKLDKRVAKFNRKLRKFVKRYGANCQSHSQRTYQKCLKRRMALNQHIAQFERGFLDDSGIPGRPWFKHTVNAPGRWSGYMAEYLPGLTEAAEDGDWTRFAQQKQVMVGILKRVGKKLK
ncbi:Vacuolar protein sorting-associated protein 70 [Dispira parvispora]|uniref:Vacuolar protein sorting-associated protein 70 n=1 Tax=Dispira parvispora TaxID=1520584 RepID=A0A9W8E6J6_9FUNG|nr:Vacuolar protein sorting-associated protein 70 [Dispira parvispora]